MVPTPPDLLAAALATDPSRPLLTAYDDASGERVELSVLTFANWVAKTANLLQDELAVEPGAVVAVRLPLHWQAAVWLQAVWAVGGAVDLDGTGPVDVAVVEHTGGAPGVDADEVVSLGLGPMGLALPGVGPVVAGALDYDRSVHAHGDRFVPVHAPDPSAAALRTAEGRVTATALASAAASSPPLAEGGRLLVTDPYADPAAVIGGLLVPLATGAAAVLCRNLDRSRLADRIGQEHLVAALGRGDAGLPAYRPAQPVLA